MVASTLYEYYSGQGKTLGKTAAERFADPAFAEAAKTAGYDVNSYKVNAGNAAANNAILAALLKGGTKTTTDSTTQTNTGTNTGTTPPADTNTPTVPTGIFRPIYGDEPATVTAQTEEEVQAKLRTAAQAEIDSLNKYYDGLRAEQVTVNEGNSRGTDAISLLTGLGGSTEAKVQADKTIAGNNKALNKIEAERGAAINAILFDIRKSAVEQARQSRLDAKQSETDRLAFREKAQKNAVKQLTTLAQSATGVTLAGLKSTLKPDEYENLIKNVGGEAMASAILFEHRSKDSLLGTPQLIGGKMVQAYQTADGKVRYENIDLPAGINPGNIKSIEKTDNGIFIINNDGTYSKVSGSGKIESGGGGGIDTSGLTPEQASDPFIKKILSTKGGKPLTDTTIQKLDKGLTVLGQLGVLQSNIKDTRTNPIVGAFRGANPWDTNAQTIKAQLNAIVPNLARGVYGEVGVLTDNDIKTYSKTLPNLTSTEQVRNAVLYITLDMIGKSVQNTLNVNASAGRDVSKFVDIYTEMQSNKNSILSQIPGAQVPQAFQEAAKIRVRINATGQTGTIDASEFDAKTMTKI